MGNCQSQKYDKEAAQINREIDARLLKERKQGEEYKLLLLGTGESGKSTIAKQMKIIHLSGFTKEERVGYKSIVYNNVLHCARALLLCALKRKLPLSLPPEEIEMIEGQPQSINLYPLPLAKAISSLWRDPSIQLVYSNTHFTDSTAYFMTNAERISDPDYIPSDLDILKVRVKSTGITETVFSHGKNKFRMVDVGGQRNERKKWIHCFQDVTAIIFCVATNEYDMTLEEDVNVNRMHESLKLFHDVINNEWFWNTKIILFLNKEDLFIEKIKKVDLSTCFPNYDGGLSFDNASKYIERKFKEKNLNANRPINSKFTCATDTSNIRYVFGMLESFLFEEVMSSVMPF